MTQPKLVHDELVLSSEIRLKYARIIGAYAKRISFVRLTVHFSPIEVLERMIAQRLERYSFHVRRRTNLDRYRIRKQMIADLIGQTNRMAESIGPDLVNDVEEVGIVGKLANVNSESNVVLFNLFKNGVELFEANRMWISF